MLIESWLRVHKHMFTLNSAIWGLNMGKTNLVARMRRVFLGLLVFLIWEERNKRIFENTYKRIELIFHKFQVLFYTILHFHKKKSSHFQCWLMVLVYVWLFPYGWVGIVFFKPITWAVISVVGIYLQLLSSFLCLFYCSMFYLATMSLPLRYGANSWPSAVVGLACHYPLNAGVLLPIVWDCSK